MSFKVILRKHKIDPIDYDETMSDVDAHLWKRAMEVKLESMYFNEVWELVKVPKGIKLIGCKWAYKRNKGVDGRVKTYEARLVVKGYSQKLGLNYEESFLLVAMLKSIRILMSIATHFDYEIWQMDVRTAFLNDNLNESIYMMQSNSFVVKDQEHMVYKLHKSIYGLKQASQSWNKCFN